MSLQSAIEWTDATWNPVRGCDKISPGCKRCYAAVFAERFRGVANHPYEQGFDLRLVPEQLDAPLHWEQPRLVFVNSMSDLFHEDVPDDYIEAVADVMVRADWHTYQVLTKRSERMRDLLRTKLGWAAAAPHIWWGVSVEDRKYGLPRIEHLRQAPAVVRFLSVEPLLEDLGPVDLTGIHWVIAGGESGRGARPMDPAWVRSLLAQSQAAGVPFFFKQWGGPDKKKTGRLLDGRTYDEMPPRLAVAPPRRKDRLALIADVGEQAMSWLYRLELNARAADESEKTGGAAALGPSGDPGSEASASAGSASASVPPGQADQDGGEGGDEEPTLKEDPIPDLELDDAFDDPETFRLPEDSEETGYELHEFEDGLIAATKLLASHKKRAEPLEAQVTEAERRKMRGSLGEVIAGLVDWWQRIGEKK